MPLTTLCDKATARVYDCDIVRRWLAHDGGHKKVHKRNVLALERTAIQPPLDIEAEHLVYEPSHLTGNSVTKLNNCLRHTHSLSGEAR